MQQCLRRLRTPTRAASLLRARGAQNSLSSLKMTSPSHALHGRSAACAARRARRLLLASHSGAADLLPVAQSALELSCNGRDVPLVVPVVLLRHYVRKYDEPYLKRQYYLHPHPTELMLRNHV